MTNFFSRVSIPFFAVALLCCVGSAKADDVKKGETIYNGVGACAACHGPKGAGDGPAGASLNPKPKNFAKGDFGLDTDKDGKTGTEADILNVITNGAAKYGGSPLMAGRPDIAEADRKAIAKFILSLNTTK